MSTRESVTVLRKRNKEKILEFFQDRIGPPPTGSLCPRHNLRSKKICTSREDPSLTNAGRWFSFCPPCGRPYFSQRTLFVQGLIENDAELHALIERRKSLMLVSKPKPKPKSVSRAARAFEETFPSMKFFIFWTESGKHPAVISFSCKCTNIFSLAEHRKLLKERDVVYGHKVEVFDPYTETWAPLGWRTQYHCGPCDDILLKYAEVDNLTDFGMYHS